MTEERIDELIKELTILRADVAPAHTRARIGAICASLAADMLNGDERDSREADIELHRCLDIIDRMANDLESRPDIGIATRTRPISDAAFEARRAGHRLRKLIL